MKGKHLAAGAPRRGNGAVRAIGRGLLVLFTAVFMLVLALYLTMAIVIHGPSPDAKRLLVLSLNETSALKWVSSLYLPRAEIDGILAGSVQGELQTETPDSFQELDFAPEVAEQKREEAAGQPTPPAEQPALEIVDVKGATYKGKLMRVRDPARVIVGTLDHYGTGYGLYLKDFIAKYGAVAGTNAGGFEDYGGTGTGAVPDGLVIRDGQLAWGEPDKEYNNVIGFDADNRLVVGAKTGQEALDAGLVSAVSFAPGPVLVADGVKQTGLGGGLNPRTCIGQRADGTVLILVVEGRHPDSFGASYDDLAQLMADEGAVNAANLDGGSSSAMIVDGEQITRGSNIIGSRQMATAILVLPEVE